MSLQRRIQTLARSLVGPVAGKVLLESLNQWLLASEMSLLGMIYFTSLQSLSNLLARGRNWGESEHGCN